MDFQAMLAQQQETVASGAAFVDKPAYKADERFYTISKDADGNGTVTVRLIPSVNANKTGLNMFVKRLVHNAKGSKLFPGKDKPDIRSFWGDEAICPKTISSDNKCPICDYGWAEWKAQKDTLSKEDVGKILGNWVSKEEYITNIQIINDKINPSNNGKIFLFKLSKTIVGMFQKEAEQFNELVSTCSPEERLARGIPSDLTFFDPYNLMCSKNLVLKYKSKKHVKTPIEYWNSSYFDSIYTGIAKNMDEYQQLATKAYCLDEFTTNAVVKDEDFLEEKLKWLLFDDVKPAQPAQQSTAVNHEAQPAQQTVPVQPVEESVVQNIVQQTVPVQPVEPVVTNTVVQQAPVEPVEPVALEPVSSSQEDFFAKFKV